MSKSIEANKPYCKTYHWQDVRGKVGKLNPRLAKVIDNVNPDKNHLIYECGYPYGSSLLVKGLFYLPNANGEIVELTDPTIAPTMRDNLSYNSYSNPAMLGLENTCELFAALEHRIIPLTGLIKPGEIFGTYIVLTPGMTHQPVFIWDMTAGARNIFMLAKIAETEKYNKLKKYLNIKIETPRSWMDHWQVFKTIANQKDFSSPWMYKVLLFSKHWFSHRGDTAWAEFNQYLLESAWMRGDFWRNNFFWNIIFSLIHAGKNVKPNPYILDTVKHLYNIGVSGVPGLAPALDEMGAPIKGLQTIFNDIYGLKNYAATIMQPTMYNYRNPAQGDVYYSLQIPTAPELGPKLRNRTSAISDLYDIMSLTKKINQSLLENKYNLQDTPLYYFATTSQFDYYHGDPGHYRDIQQSILLETQDPHFLATMSDKELPHNSTFFKGCIRIHSKTSTS